MRIRSVHIENFRSIRELTCDFGAVTSLIGPNGAGKSNIIRALDWFFNGEKDAVGPEDLHHGCDPGDRIRVRVDFEDLTEDDREALGTRYCPEDSVNRFTAWRSWQDGEEKITGRAFAYGPFERVRAGGSAAERKSLYGEIRSEHGLPAWTTNDAAERAMATWELENPDELTEAEVSDSHFFGFNGRGVLSNLFDFVFVSADLRASEETVGQKNSLIERILNRTIDREAFETAVDGITSEFETDYRALGERYLDDQLNSVAQHLTEEVSNYSPGRAIRVFQEAGTVKPPPALVGVRVDDRGAETPVTYQGHGFQRTLLLAGLTVLSQQTRNGASSTSSMFLAIEEPELFQHPTQARAFASVLRHLADDESQRTQVAYATHSPHFVSPRYFDEVRRISSRVNLDGQPESTLEQATIATVQERLEGFVDSDNVERRFEQVCLKNLPDALFAGRVILVEGDQDAAIIEGIGDRINKLAVQGICVAPTGGKTGMMIPMAILEALGIETVMVVDNDSGCGDRMRGDGKNEEVIHAAEAKHVKENRELCRFVGATEVDYPVGRVAENLAFVPDTLESLLDSDLPGWNLSLKTVIDEGRGVEGKHAATYQLAVRECEGKLGWQLQELADVCVGNAA